MRILHVYKTAPTLSKGGVENFLNTLCKHSDLMGVSNTIFSMSKIKKPKETQLMDFKLIEVPELFKFASTSFSIQAFEEFKRISDQVDLVHYNFPNPFGDLLHFASRPSKPTVVTYHSDIVRQKSLRLFYTPLMHKFLNDVDAIVATSENYLNSSKILQIYEESTKVIPLGIDKSDYPNPTEQRLQKWRSRLTFPFFVGQLRYYKVEVFIRNQNTDLQVAIAGDGECKHALQTQAKINSSENVTFLGDITELDKVALLKLCNAFIFPSNLRSEAFGFSLLEAAIFEKPQITCEIGTGTSYVNLNGVTGFCIKPADPGELREAMQRIVSNPKATREMGANAELRAKRIFSAKKQAENYVTMFERLIETKAKNNPQIVR